MNDSSQRSHRDIVYDFAEVLSQLNLPILDERLLPHPKSEIHTAFHIYTTQLQAMAQHSEDSRQELAEVQGVAAHIDQFQKIDPEDLPLVSEINTGRRFEKFRSSEGRQQGCANAEEEETLNIYLDITTKYMLRGF